MMAQPELNLEDLDSATLYRLAQEKEQAEREAQKRQRHARLEELRTQRLEILARHRKELAEIERELSQEKSSRKRTRTSSTKTRRRGGEGPSISEILISTIGEKKAMPIEEIRERCLAQGLHLSTITQMLAYLKRTGRLESPSRGTYSVASNQD